MKRVWVLSVITIAIILAACASSKETPGVWVNKETFQHSGIRSLEFT